MVVCDKPYHRTNIHHRHIVLSRNNEFYRNSLLHKKGGLYPPNPVILTHLATNIYFWWFNWIITCKAGITESRSSTIYLFQDSQENLLLCTCRFHQLFFLMLQADPLMVYQYQNSKDEGMLENLFLHVPP